MDLSHWRKQTGGYYSEIEEGAKLSREKTYQRMAQEKENWDRVSILMWYASINRLQLLVVFTRPSIFTIPFLSIAL